MKYFPSALEENLQMCHWPHFRLGMHQAGCCRAVPVVKYVSVKVDASSLYTFLYLCFQTQKLSLRVMRVCDHKLFFFGPESAGRFCTRIFLLDKLYQFFSLHGQMWFLCTVLTQPAKLKQVLLSGHRVEELCTELSICSRLTRF